MRVLSQRAADEGGARLVCAAVALSALTLGLAGCFTDTGVDGSEDSSESSSSSGSTTDASTSGSTSSTTDPGSTSSTSSSGTTTATSTSGSTGGTSTGPDVLLVPDLMPGDLIITEVMADPLCGTNDPCEWFEIHNRTETPVDIQGLDVGRGTDTTTGEVQISRIVEPGGFAILTRDAANWPYSGEPPSVYGTTFQLGNMPIGRVRIEGPLTVIDRTPVFGDATPGVSLSLDPMEFEPPNDEAVEWCLSTSSVSTPDGPEFATPGLANDGCPATSPG